MTTNRTTRFAIVGAGHWGPNLIRNFNEIENSTVVAVVERDPERRALIADRYAGVEVFEALEHVLDHEDVEAVVVATPSATHHDLAKKALSRGKHVMVEKPIAASASEAQELCELAEDRGVVLMVGHVFLFNEGVRRVKGYIDRGELGEIHYVSAVRTNLGPIRVDANASWDLATHDISIANYWLGSHPMAASAVGGSWINPGIEDAVFITLRYPDDAIVNIHASWLSPRKTRDLIVVGEDQMLTFSDMDLSEPIRLYEKTVTDQRTEIPVVDTFASFRSSVREGQITIPNISMGEPLRAECEHFVRCIREGTSPLTDGWSGLDVVKVLEAIDRSMKNGGAEEAVR